jgi:carboxylesterase type B
MGEYTLVYGGYNVWLTQCRPICPQPKITGYEEELFGLTEDVIPPQTLKQNESECLNLNITCPSSALPGSLLPVMFFIHGYVYRFIDHVSLLTSRSGGNRGTGSSWLYDGGALVQRSVMVGKPVILVTIK